MKKPLSFTDRILTSAMEKMLKLRLLIPNQTDKNGTSYTSNKAVLTGLQPGTTYYYQVAGKPVHSFQTGTSDKFTFAFVGDPQIGSSNELKGSDTEEFYNAQSNAVASDSTSSRYNSRKS